MPTDLISLIDIIYLNLITNVAIDTRLDVFSLDNLYSLIFTVVTYGKTVIVLLKELYRQKYFYTLYILGVKSKRSLDSRRAYIGVI